MKFGVREICDVTFKALQDGKLGNKDVKKGQPVLYIDSAKTSTIEGAATTVYAQGGRGNARLIAWEGEKTLTFTVEDALLSEIGFAVLSGAGLFDSLASTYNVHCTEIVTATASGLALNLAEGDVLTPGSPIFVMKYENGTVGDMVTDLSIGTDKKSLTGTGLSGTYFVDYYVVKKAAVTEMNIDAENFAGYYYVEASTLFRRESDGQDLPAEIIFPRVKIQSNFTFNMASTGDPSTFTFTMDAMPGNTWFEKGKKVLCAIQVIDESSTIAAHESVTNEAYVETVTTANVSAQVPASTPSKSEE